MKKIWAKILRNNPHLEAWNHRLQVLTLPGLDGVAVMDVYEFFTAEIKKNSLVVRSQAIAYSFFLSLFPAILFIFSLVPFVLSMFDTVDVDIYISNLVRGIAPSPDVYNFLWGIIAPLIKEFTHKRPSLLTGTFLLTLYLASNGVVAMMTSFDKTTTNYRKRNVIMTRLVALKISLLIVALFTFSIVLVVLGQDILEWLLNLVHIRDKFTRGVFTVVRYLSVILLFFFSISLIYY
jgi:membrane protein